MGDQRKKRPNELLKATWDICVSTKNWTLFLHTSPMPQSQHKASLPRNCISWVLWIFKVQKSWVWSFSSLWGHQLHSQVKWPHLLSGTKTPCRAFRCEQWVTLLFVNDHPIQPTHPKKSMSALCMRVLPKQTFTQHHRAETPTWANKEYAKDISCGTNSNISTVLASYTQTKKWRCGGFTFPGQHHRTAGTSGQHRIKFCFFGQH